MPSAPRLARSPSSPPSSSPTTRFAPSPSPILPPRWNWSACRGARWKVPRWRGLGARSPPPGSLRAIWPAWRTRRPVLPPCGSLPPKELEQRLAVSLDADGQVQDGASRTLARARRAVREARARLVKQLDAMLAALDPTDRAPDAAVTVREGRYVIPVRSTARARIGGIVHDESATRATVFIEPPEVIELGNALRAAELDEQREVLQVLRDLTELLRPHHDAIAAAWEMCVAFDDLCARARYAVEVNGFAPTIGPGPLEIRAGRHPLLLGATESAVVPFDLVLAPDEFTVLVSGPNTGGKTVLIKAVGLLALMAQSGIIPPIGRTRHSRSSPACSPTSGTASRSPRASPLFPRTWPCCGTSSSAPQRDRSCCSTRSAAAPTPPREARSRLRCCSRSRVGGR